MSRSRRYAGALAAALVAVLVPAGTVAAEQVPTVTFNGGCGVQGVGAASEPDADALSVPAEGTVLFVNHLGVAANLLVNDRPAGTLRANEEVPVVFHHGPVSVKLAPSCLPAAEAVPVGVEVSPPVRARIAPGSVPAAAPGATRAVTPRQHHPSRILVLVAVICVVGVSVATIRAIITQRAIRTVSA